MPWSDISYQPPLRRDNCCSELSRLGLNDCPSPAHSLVQLSHPPKTHVPLACATTLLTTSQKLSDHPCWQSHLPTPICYSIQVDLGTIALQKPSHQLLPTGKATVGSAIVQRGWHRRVVEVGTYSHILALVLVLPHPLTPLIHNWHLGRFERSASRKPLRAFGVQNRAGSGHNHTSNIHPIHRGIPHSHQ